MLFFSCIIGEVHTWQKALESKNKNTPKEQFINCYEILTGQKLQTRDYPITAGGAYNDLGRRLPPNIPTWKSVCTQNWSITEQNLQSLEENKFITVLEKHKVNITNSEANYVCKYRYPDLRDINNDRLAEYSDNLDQTTKNEINELLNRDVSNIARLLGWKVKIPIALKDLDNDQFVTLIAGPREYQELEKETRQIQKPLVAIKNALKNDPSYSKLLQDFAPLNQKFLDNVLNNILEKNDISPLERYQALISLHPLKDLNGRCTRLFFQKESGKPF